MALFKKDPKKEVAVENKEVKEVKETKKVTKQQKIANDLSWVIKAPRITEKAAFISSDNAYTFNVSPDANKIQIKNAVEEQYKVKPVKVNIINRKAHKEMRRGRKIHVSGTKKAVVFLKKGDSIELV